MFPLSFIRKRIQACPKTLSFLIMPIFQVSAFTLWSILYIIEHFNKYQSCVANVMIQRTSCEQFNLGYALRKMPASEPS